MAFKFRLEKVMKVRQRAVEQQSLKVAAAEQVLVQLTGERDRLDGEIFRFMRSAGVQRGTLAVQDLLGRTSWHQHLWERRDQLTGTMAEAQVRVDTERVDLNRLWRDLEVLKQLKRTQKEAWQAEMAARENRDLDEIGQIRADRQRREKVSTDLAHTA